MKKQLSMIVALGVALGLAVTPAIAQEECIYLEKVGPDVAVPGQTIEYAFTVRNDCDFNLLSGIQCYDELLNGLPWDNELLMGETKTFTLEYLVTEDDCEALIVNTAQCTGADAGGSPMAISNVAEWQVWVDCDDCDPGTGTPGYWKNHPDAWPVEEITIGGVTYEKDEAIDWMKQSVSGDKTITMFKALVAAKLNILGCNESSCILETIAAADAWMATYGPVGSGVAASTPAWRMGDPLYEMLDKYNNGKLCAPSRD